MLSFEYHAEQITKILPIEIEVYGFDTGEGLPKPLDYRDLPLPGTRRRETLHIDLESSGFVGRVREIMA